MGIGVSIFLVAVGAILAFAVETSTRGVNLDAVGLILMIVGAFGILLSLMFWSSWGGWGGGGPRDETIIMGGEGGHDVHHHH